MQRRIALTEYSHGAGCGCKIAPAALEKILSGRKSTASFPQLLVGNETNDDAAVWDLGNGQSLIGTTDFFLPIVNDPFTFGAIAATNALSDVYAMGGKPLMALAILGWPVEKLPAEIAQQVLAGATSICDKANIPIAGGHSIDSQEPIFGLSVNGLVATENIKKNNQAKVGDLLYLTKPIGTGIITTALKRKDFIQEDVEHAIHWMTQLNDAGVWLGELPYIQALTDVTGFAMLGHTLEMAKGSNLSVKLLYPQIPLMPNLSYYLQKMIYPDNTMRNWSSYQHAIKGIGAESFLTLNDPQTSGGLLIAVDKNEIAEFEKQCLLHNLPAVCVGEFFKENETFIHIIDAR
jgi:selenide,water dikinase